MFQVPSIARAAVAMLLLAPAALASDSGTSSPAPPDSPTVDFSTLSGSAVHRPTNLDGNPHQVELKVVADRVAVRPGDTMRLGLHMLQDQGWHTYWKSNTEIGKPTEITWKLLDGVDTAYEYAIPQRFALSDIISFGYDKEAFFFTEVTLPADLPPGMIEVGAEATWLTCEAECIPGQGAVSMPIEVLAADAPEPALTQFAPLFEHFSKQHPATDFNGVQITSTVEPSPLEWDKPFSVTMHIVPDEGRSLGKHKGDIPWPTFVPITQQEAWFLDGTEVVHHDDGSMSVVMKGETFTVEEVPQNEQVGGLFSLVIDGAHQSAEVLFPMPWPDTVAAADCDCSESATAVDVATVPVEELGDPNLDEETCATVLGMTVAETADQGGVGTLLYMLGFAFLGGLILNIMPCVLPVLTLKLYGLVEQADMEPADRQKLGMAYTGGVVASFLALAALVIVLQQAMGLQIGQGFQFQSPAYVAALSAIVFVFGLSLFGVFELPAFGANAASEAGAKEGVGGMFFSGIFATLLATPCSAPFLGSAMGYAFSQPPVIILLMFFTVGLGLAFPLLAISFIPALFKLMPNPGAWMETFKQLMGFTLVATALWLVDVLAAQVSGEATFGFIAFMAVLSLAAWVFGHFGGVAATYQRQAIAGVAALGIGVGGGWLFLDFEPPESGMKDEIDGAIHWKIFGNDRMASVLNRYRDGEDVYFDGKPIFIDFTAEWCLSCKVIESTVIATQTVEDAMVAHDVVTLKADWTNYNEEITNWLSCFGRAGVPYYVVLPADPSKPAISLGEAPSPSDIVEALQQAAAVGV